jgi:hypothetical protein
VVTAQSKRWKLVVGAGVACAFLLESSGTRGPSGGVRARTVGVAAMGAVASGWLSGAWRELLRPSRDGCARG